MGGTLTVTSKVGQGTIFKITLPLTEAQAAEAPVGGHQPGASRVVSLEPNQPPYRLLIVEDNHVSRNLLVKLLEPLGFEVKGAANGQEGIHLWQQWQPHLIWMDMRMPVMDGYTATQRIKNSPLTPKPVIVALTANAFEENRQEILAIGCDDFVRKPFKEAEILQVIQKHLGGRYQYAQPPSQNETKTTQFDAQLAALPPALLADLRQAAAHFDVAQVERSSAKFAGTIPPV
jgi:CheY-like chemotaxis protein